MAVSGGWTVERTVGSAAEHHGRDVEADAGRAVWVHEVTAPALVLGSTQDPSVVDRTAAAAAGIEVVRRRSGGGAVLVEPEGVVWVDVVIPPTDPLWDDDVGRAAHWVGRAWAAALTTAGVPGPEVHTGRLATTEWSDLACFAGLGPGEVTIDGAKVVGVSQRRTRHGARFQTAVLRRWRPADLVALLDVGDHRTRREAVDDLSTRARAVDVDGEALVDALVASLPS